MTYEATEISDPVPEDDECRICHQLMSLPFGLEPAPWCNQCAQELLPKLLQALKDIIGSSGVLIRRANARAVALIAYTEGKK